MFDAFWPKSNGSGGKKQPLPKPNAVVAMSGTQPGEFTQEMVRGMIVNPIYTGLGPYPRLIDDERWIRACARVIQEEGAEQFLVNMLHVLHETLRVEDE